MTVWNGKKKEKVRLYFPALPAVGRETRDGLVKDCGVDGGSGLHVARRGWALYMP